MNASTLPPAHRNRADSAAPEPLRWRLPPSAWQRVRRASAVPIAAAAAVFAAIVLISIVTVWLAPNSPSIADTGGEVLSLSDSVSLRSSFPDSTDADTGSGAGAGSGESSAAAAPGRLLFVHVVGEVHEPGVYELAEGSRVSDAIDAAGGATEAAMLAAVNLARPLSDGEQIIVPDSAAAAAVGPGGGAATGAGPAGVAGASGLVNLNTADLAALETLHGVGPALANRIIDWRAANGKFSSIEQLLDVAGIGERTFEQLRAKVTI